jgi:hypothetical protein
MAKRFQLQEAVLSYVELFKSFEALLENRTKLCIADDRISTALCKLYATRGAFNILMAIRSCVNIELDFSRNLNGDGEQTFKVLPTYETVRKAAQELLSAVSATAISRVILALTEMGIPILCPKAVAPYSEMEQLAAQVSGQAQACFLVEISLFAVENGEYERAGNYVALARKCNPRSMDSYHLCMIEGLIAFNEGRIHNAIRRLHDSLEACFEDVETATECNAFAPYLELVEKLLEHGERIEVLRHLSDSQDLWLRLRPEIAQWMVTIERGDFPDFHSPESVHELNQPAWKLRIQWLRACSLEADPYPINLRVRMSRKQVLAEREESLAREGTGLDAWVNGEIEYLGNSPATGSDGLDSKK